MYTLQYLATIYIYNDVTVYALELNGTVINLRDKYSLCSPVPRETDFTLEWKKHTSTDTHFDFMVWCIDSAILAIVNNDASYDEDINYTEDTTSELSEYEQFKLDYYSDYKFVTIYDENITENNSNSEL